MPMAKPSSCNSPTKMAIRTFDRQSAYLGTDTFTYGLPTIFVGSTLEASLEIQRKAKQESLVSSIFIELRRPGFIHVSMDRCCMTLKQQP